MRAPPRPSLAKACSAAARMVARVSSRRGWTRRARCVTAGSIGLTNQLVTNLHSSVKNPRWRRDWAPLFGLAEPGDVVAEGEADDAPVGGELEGERFARQATAFDHEDRRLVGCRER